MNDMEPNAPFTNREITEKWNDLSETLERIESQTAKTNGRVSALEKWMYVAIGGMSVISVVLVPLFGWMLKSVANTDDKIQQAVQETLQAYDITYEK
jgi:uncharacterized membrane protein (DUF106 family)